MKIKVIVIAVKNKIIVIILNNAAKQQTEVKWNA